MLCDARGRESVQDVLIALVEHALLRARKQREPAVTT